jgi:hypothetical protein
MPAVARRKGKMVNELVELPEAFDDDDDSDDVIEGSATDSTPER